MVCLLFIRYIYCISFLITLCISFGDFTFVVRATCKPVFRARVLIWAFNMVSRLFGGSLHLFLFSCLIATRVIKFPKSFGHVVEADVYSWTLVFYLFLLCYFNRLKQCFISVVDFFLWVVEFVLFLSILIFCFDPKIKYLNDWNRCKIYLTFNHLNLMSPTSLY